MVHNQRKSLLLRRWTAASIVVASILSSTDSVRGGFTSYGVASSSGKSYALGSASQGVALALSIDTKTPTIGSPIEVTVHVRNTTNHDIVVALLGDASKECKFSVYDSSGIKLSMVPNPNVGCIGEYRPGNVVPRGSEFYESVDLNALFEFQSPGDYQVLATSDVPVYSGDHSSSIAHLHSTTLDLHIAPKS